MLEEAMDARAMAAASRTSELQSQLRNLKGDLSSRIETLASAFAAYVELDGIRECAVVGVPHPHTGEAVKAFVVVEAGYALEEDAVIEHAAKHLARYKCPQKVNFVEELPVNLSGKVLRRALR